MRTFALALCFGVLALSATSPVEAKASREEASTSCHKEAAVGNDISRGRTWAYRATYVRCMRGKGYAPY